jgi:hypothetical protein
MLDPGREALVRKVLGDPDYYPPELETWIQRRIETSPTFRLVQSQLPEVEKIHLVGGSGEPSFQNSYAAYNPGYADPSFYRDPWGHVFLDGLVKRTGAPVTGETIYLLPGGYRPQKAEVFDVLTDTGLGRVDIAASGAVAYISGGTVWISLSGLNFRAYG